MKWLWAAAGVVAVVWGWIALTPADTSEPAEPFVIEAPKEAPEPASGLGESSRDDYLPPDAADPAVATIESEGPATDDRDQVINIGEPMDPNDPSTWPQSESTEVINIGEPMDPDDPSTWPQSESTEVINIGEPMDPDDPSTWPQPENSEVSNIGEPMDPDDPSTWPQSENTEVINIGEPMDPDDPVTWQ